MKRKIFAAIAIPTIIVVAYLSMVTYFGGLGTTHLQLKDGTIIEAEIKDSPYELGQGLTRYDEIPDHWGALFIFPKESYYKFWTKDMHFSIDMIWMNKDFKVVEITKWVPPCPAEDCPTYEAQKPAKYVLEMKGGLADLYNITEGDTIRRIN